jgi:hypothetical protein
MFGQLVKKFLYFMELEESLTYLQEPSSGPYSKPDHFSPYSQTLSFKISFHIISHLRLDLESGLLSSGFPFACI